MFITVAICTWNRGDLLERTLEQMRALKIPPGVEWELLVVDNNCTDHTKQVISQSADFLPLCSVVERREGLSHARNRCIDEARGDWIFWTDDDVLVSPDWLMALVAGIQDHPDAAFVGGTVKPWFESTPPSWVKDNLDILEGAYAIRELGSKTRWLEPGELPFGANFGVQREAFALARFDADLGVRGDVRICGEETKLLNELRLHGRRGLWVGGATVRHFVPKHRLEQAYIRKVAHGYGYAMGVRNRDTSVKKLFGRPRWAVARYLRHRFWEVIFRPSRSRSWLQSLQEAAIHAGIIAAYRDRSVAEEASG